MNISILGQNIKKIRELQNVSAYKLSKLANIGASTVSEIETGKRQSLNTTTVEKIANALGVSADDLFTTEVNKEYVVSDIEQTIALILSSDDLLLDDINMTIIERNQFRTGIKAVLDIIRIGRNNELKEG